ncbi:hypothetical protein Airi01_063530 [Actinoallomurus iriomotensis]|uniref:DUF222 domain-containing protein n=2 Tax=Actinoallomurus iriomotensis TaxID=478107 RepID=A0A9W6RKY2_9ACTN|nr:hypothetical protein Airi01_063530 [Actinoallomurus iriomotensis]
MRMVTSLPGELSDRELVEVMVEARQLASRVQAVELAAIAELARRRFAEAEDRDAVVEVLSAADHVHDEVAEALTLTSASADGLVRFATELTERLPGTFAALASGRIDYLKARTMWHGIDQVDDRLASTVEKMVLPKAPEQTTGQIRAKIRRLIKRLDPQAADRRREEAETHRAVELVETAEGTARLSGVDLPADAAGAAYGRVTAIATGLEHDGDDRATDRLRADVFLGLLHGTFVTGEPPADTTDRPTLRTGDPGWTAVYDAIAETARTELTTLTNTLAAPPRDIHRDVVELLPALRPAVRPGTALSARSAPRTASPVTGRPRRCVGWSDTGTADVASRLPKSRPHHPLPPWRRHLPLHPCHALPPPPPRCPLTRASTIVLTLS